jgi:Fe(3+) dicitrate transport protein
MTLKPLLLPVAVGLALIQAPRAEASPQPAAEPAADPAPELLRGIEVLGENTPDPRFPGISPTVEKGKVKAGKKTTRVELEEQPVPDENALRTMLARVPGVLVSELREPAYVNLNYRGLGDPHESEFITLLEEGVPIASDWFGYPTAYYMPAPGRVQAVEFIRGGSALIYGPQPGPSLNFITRRPQFDSEIGGRTDHVVGSHGLYHSFNELTVGSETLALLADYDHRSADGQRDNGDYEVDSGRLAVAIRAGERSVFDLEYSFHESESGEAGRLSSAQFALDPELTRTPFNRVFIDREALRLRNDTRLTDTWTLHAVYQRTSLDRDSRRSSAFVPPQAPPASTDFDRQQFESDLIDLRVLGDVSEQHSLSAGFTWYRDDSPRERLRSEVLDGPYGGTPVFRQERETSYAAAFVEMLLRFDRLTLVPALRYEDVSIDIEETLVQASLGRDPIDRRFDRNETLLGFGALYELGADQQFYANLSEAYRPMRFDDLANPTGALGPANDPDPANAVNMELGLRGRPLRGLYYDVSLFRIELEDKIEQRVLTPSDILRVNSGDSRHQGIEFALEYELLNPAGEDGADGLLLFANASLLDAEITASESAGLVGNEPAFAPDRILRAGALYSMAARLQVGLTATHVSEHFWQDSNRAGGSASDPIAATIPSYTVVDLNARMPLGKHVELLGGVGNLLDRQYYSRVRSDGIEPANERTWYLGASLSF